MRRRGRSGNTTTTTTTNASGTTHRNSHACNSNHNTATATATAAVTSSNSHNSNTATSSSSSHICLTAAAMSSSNSRKDDPVFNVRFVQLVESHPCLWNSTLPAYSKKEEIQRAWQDVAADTKDTVRNCRERWRTIRSSFLRSLKLSRTSTGRGKRKYYLSKYLQFLIPYTKTRLKNGSASAHAHTAALRKMDTATTTAAAAASASAAATTVMAAAVACATSLPPMTRINHMPLPIVSSEDTKDSTNSEIAIAEDDVVVSLHEGAAGQTQPAPPPPLQTQQQQQQQQRLLTIKSELGTEAPVPEQRRCTNATNGGCGGNNANASSSNNNNNSNFLMDTLPARSSSAVDLTEFAEWIKCRNDPHRHCLLPATPDADQSFLNSLHPFLKEMSGKQNRRFRQKVVALIDAILDNAD